MYKFKFKCIIKNDYESFLIINKNNGHDSNKQEVIFKKRSETFNFPKHVSMDNYSTVTVDLKFITMLSRIHRKM